MADGKPGRGSDQFPLRLPDGLRDRIKAYAERHGRSMNAEIVRVLEREFPQQWPVSDRLDELAAMMVILRSGSTDPRFDSFVNKFEETVEGIVSGRVTDVKLEERESITGLWNEYRLRQAERDYEATVDAGMDLDDDEQRTFDLIGQPEKYAVPPPRRKEWHEMTDDEHKEWRESEARNLKGPPLADLLRKAAKGD